MSWGADGAEASIKSWIEDLKAQLEGKLASACGGATMRDCRDVTGRMDKEINIYKLYCKHTHLLIERNCHKFTKTKHILKAD